MATDEQKITLKVFVNKTKDCVAFVESDLDFVDVLLSFLTLPVGTVVRLLNKRSSLGCFDKLYQGVERLDKKYLATEACRSMLTKPVNSSGVTCQKLKINIDDMGDYYSSLECHCGEGMDEAISYDLNQDNVNYEECRGVFIRGDKFLVTDALLVASIEHATSSFFGCCGDWTGLEERSIGIKRAQSLVSDTPLTDVLLRKEGDISPKFSVPPVKKTVAIEALDKKKIIYRIKLSLVGNKVLYAEASQDFVNEIFSFLTFPLGTLKKQLGGRCRITCLNNLYDSARQLHTLGCMVPGCEERLLNPKLPPYFNCNNRAIEVEVAREEMYYACDYRCRLSSTRYYCSSPFHYGRKAKRALLLDPKTSPKGLDFPKGSFCKKLTYIVSDELVVTPFSFTSLFSLRRQISEPVKMVELGIDKEEVCLSSVATIALHLTVRLMLLSLFVFQVLDLLDAALSSSTALTEAFFDRANAALYLVDEKGE
ncbi:uncharacterized protein LOC122011140 [Zingiber officinale]|uniref:DUF674 family protein n=1 Tax=Zingiber officinale TaxID=94328 RepID=A0A8J5FHT8_ZINOF|nr:uncharacterized protein LOC122011140 [Zingiber officinale]KAG6487680.1 hypothetical protein ZIOFF_056271 [Zingiber officinale]